MTRFRTFVAAPGARRLIAASFAARLPIAMTYTAIVLLVLATRGDAALAGLCAAAFGLVEGIGSPVQGRLVDRFGQPRVLVPAATVYAAALAGVVAGAESGAPSWVLVALAGLCGAGFPVVSSAMRALWPSVVDDETKLSTTYALESVIQTLGFVAGPLLVAALVASISPAGAVIGTAVLALAGTVAFTSTPASRAWRPAPRVRRSRLGALAAPGVRTIVGGTFALAAAGGVADVTCPAVGSEAGSPALGALLVAVLCAGAPIGGALYGSHHSDRGARDYVAFSALIAAGFVAVALAAGSIVLLAPVLFVAGMALAPMLASGYRLIERLAPAGMVTEAFAWTSTAFGTAGAGALIEAHGTRFAFAFGAAAAALGALVTAARRSTLGAQPAPTPIPTPQPQEA
jgi:predicted MFS family arabinose efflux permease